MSKTSRSLRWRAATTKKPRNNRENQSATMSALQKRIPNHLQDCLPAMPARARIPF
ncbi:hypothetical protein PWP93_27310 [Paraburkholderia sp. A1RI-2L]|uniref:hypothetical protein n=1 Tax=Paraburkholderia sp. A1RI-2L TaxID=3028367 RepID=UPI003B80D746